MILTVDHLGDKLRLVSFLFKSRKFLPVNKKKKNLVMLTVAKRYIFYEKLIQKSFFLLILHPTLPVLSCNELHAEIFRYKISLKTANIKLSV